MNVLSDLENALSADLLRAELLRRPRPKIVDRYVVQRLLGRGASGVVVEAVDERLGRFVALKLGDARVETSMLVEARALAALDHPNVVRVYDVDVVSVMLDGRPFRVWLVSMQRLEGPTVRAWLRDGSRKPDEILRVFADAGRGLAAAHDAKILHRDFKPDNVILGSDGVAQVLDFGFAAPATSVLSDLTGAQPEVAGTDPYMAPEARLARANRRSDQYSFGVSMVEALAGEPLPASGGAPRGVSSALWAVLVRATAPEPGARFPSMTDLLTALGRVPRARSGRGWRVARRLLVLGLVLAAAYVWVERPIAARAAYRRARTYAFDVVARLSPRPSPNDERRSMAGSSSSSEPQLAVVDTGSEGASIRVAPRAAHVADAGPPTSRVEAAGSSLVAVAAQTRPPDAGVGARVCPRIDGTFLITTQGRAAADRTREVVGLYELSLRSETSSVRVTGFRKTGTRSASGPLHLNQPLVVTRATRLPDCAVELRAELQSYRNYTFHLDFDASRVGGTFTSAVRGQRISDRGAVAGRFLRRR